MRTKLVYERACEIKRERLHESEYKLGCNLKLEPFFKRNRVSAKRAQERWREIWRSHATVAPPISQWRVAKLARRDITKNKVAHLFFSKDLNAHIHTTQLTYTTTEVRTNTLIHINTQNKQISISETTISSQAHLIDGCHVCWYGRLRLGECKFLFSCIENSFKLIDIFTNTHTQTIRRWM